MNNDSMIKYFHEIQEAIDGHITNNYENFHVDLISELKKCKSEIDTLKGMLDKSNEDLSTIRNELKNALEYIERLEEKDTHCLKINTSTDSYLISKSEMLDWRLFFAQKIHTLVFEKNWKYKNKIKKEIKTIRESGMFDEQWYLEIYQDVSVADLDPILHYSLYGWIEGRDPSPNFSTNLYLKRNSDVAQAGINPLIHFIKFGFSENR